MKLFKVLFSEHRGELPTSLDRMVEHRQQLTHFRNNHQKANRYLACRPYTDQHWGKPSRAIAFYFGFSERF